VYRGVGNVRDTSLKVDLPSGESLVSYIWWIPHIQPTIFVRSVSEATISMNLNGRNDGNVCYIYAPFEIADVLLFSAKENMIVGT
jgi:hypothetical protein